MLWYAIILSFFFVLLLIAFCALIHYGGYLTKLFVRLGWKERKVKTNWALFSWTNMLEKLDYQADIVFFGDSITRGSHFQKQFPDKKIVNLGYSGDTLAGMIARIPMIQALRPKQLFILGGINGLTDSNVQASIKTYAKLLDNITEVLPDVSIYVQSILPLSAEKAKDICKNETILSFNQQLYRLAKERALPFIDLHPLYAKDGVLNPDLTLDGIHLYPHAYDRWEIALQEYLSAPSTGDGSLC